jgi:hypothetical protein
MNATDDGAKDHEEQDVPPHGISMLWTVECRSVCGFSKEGRCCPRMSLTVKPKDGTDYFTSHTAVIRFRRVSLP